MRQKLQTPQPLQPGGWAQGSTVSHLVRVGAASLPTQQQEVIEIWCWQYHACTWVSLFQPEALEVLKSAYAPWMETADAVVLEFNHLPCASL